MEEKKKIKLKLSTPAEVRRSLGRIINMVANGEIDAKKANTIFYGCNALLSSIRTDDQEERIKKLEELLNSNEQKS
ncbi:hypothetical protein [Clostridium saccharoperbutylacetonicum]